MSSPLPSSTSNFKAKEINSTTNRSKVCTTGNWGRCGRGKQLLDAHCVNDLGKERRENRRTRRQKKYFRNPRRFLKTFYRHSEQCQRKNLNWEMTPRIGLNHRLRSKDKNALFFKDIQRIHFLPQYPFLFLFLFTTTFVRPKLMLK